MKQNAENFILQMITFQTNAGRAKRRAKITFFSFKKKNYLKKHFFLHTSSCYAKILGEELFHTWEIPRSGSKAEDGEKEKTSWG